MNKVRNFAVFVLLAMIISFANVSPASAAAVTLQQGTATFSQVGFSVDAAIDGVIDSSGWAIDPNQGTDQIAVFETLSDINAVQLDFELHQFNLNDDHELGRFRLSYTTDDRSTFADGLNTGGDVTANWIVLTGAMISSSCACGETFTILADDSILVGGAPPLPTVYSVGFAGSFIGVTGIRLEALTDVLLPNGGPGRAFNGNFVLSEFVLDATTNESPMAVANGPYLVAVGQQVMLDSTGSSDPELDPLTETWMADGGTVAGNIYTAGSVPGIYDVQLVVNDGTVNSPPDDTIVVVYDPSGGFVTGGGWFNSPSGAYTPDDLMVFEANFDSGAPPEFSGITTTEGVQGYAGYGTGPNVFGGDFLRNTSPTIDTPLEKTTLTLTGLPPHTTISLGFLLAIIDSWDGTGCGLASPDFFNVTVDGIPIFTESFQNSTCGTQSYIPPVGVELARSVQLGFNTGGTFFGDSAYNMELDPTFQNIPHTSSTLTIEWFTSGGGWQGGTDESWALDNVVVLVADEDVTGKANFGFVAKYKKGANVPDGNTQFQFKAGDLNFHSSSYEWLVVAGDTAMFRGEGTINGEGSYTFMIWADDDNQDTFRIHIWGDNGTVYDNGSQQTLGGGSIKIHNGN